MLAGKNPVGFINQVLYKHPELFNDVKVGNNLGCGVDTAFKADDGWDPVTGLGSLDFGKLLDLYMNLP
jgi:tripeptidyl-peptidase-1